MRGFLSVLWVVLLWWIHCEGTDKGDVVNKEQNDDESVFRKDHGHLIPEHGLQGDTQFQVPDNLKDLPEELLLQESMNLMLEDSLRHIDDLLTDLEKMADEGVDLNQVDVGAGSRGKHSSGSEAPSVPLNEKDERDFDDIRRKERDSLAKFFVEIKGTPQNKRDWRWFDESMDFCQWAGIACEPRQIDSQQTDSPSVLVVTKIELPRVSLQGSVPASVIDFHYLETLNLASNHLKGEIPAYNMTKLRRLDLSQNEISGRVPSEFLAAADNLEELKLSLNQLTGSFPVSSRWTNLRLLDISHNRLSGSLSPSIERLSSLEYLIFGDNVISGRLPSMRHFASLSLLDGGSNVLSGSLEHVLSSLPDSIVDLNLGENSLWGTMSPHIFQLTNLHTIVLSDNGFSGSLPHVPSERWPPLQSLWLGNNRFTGTIPSSLFLDVQESLQIMFLHRNDFSGTIPTEIGLLTNLFHIDAMSNKFRGTIPETMSTMNPNLRLNMTDNLLTGSIPAMFCGDGAASTSMLYKEFGCDAVLCRPGTFNIHGHATLHSACVPCPTTEEGEAKDPPESKVLGRISCEGAKYVHGDLNGDGILSPREILRVLYVDTLGKFWGKEYEDWADISVPECNLEGVTCVNGEVVKIDLKNANMCSDASRRPVPAHLCPGIPAEIGELTSLEILLLTRRQHLHGSLPTEIGKLTKLRLLDISSCVFMKGTLPTELGLLTNLQSLKVVHTRFHGTIPSELFSLKSLEILHLTNNRLSGTLPPTSMPHVKELMLARNKLNGTIPTEIGSLTLLENFEAYHNQFAGSIPSEISHCTSLKRIDLFSNELTGPLPEEILQLKALQILHLKVNLLTGTIPDLGKLPAISWIDLSTNLFHGTIPQSLASSRSIVDLRLGGNMLYEPIPRDLCTNENINGGATKNFGCDGVICPLGTYSENGHAVDPNGCTKCPPGQTTLYLGSDKSSCKVYTPERILMILYEVMQGDLWPEVFNENWGNPDVDLCQWAGLSCNERGELTTVSVPLVGLDESF